MILNISGGGETVVNGFLLSSPFCCCWFLLFVDILLATVRNRMLDKIGFWVIWLIFAWFYTLHNNAKSVLKVTDQQNQRQNYVSFLCFLIAQALEIVFAYRKDITLFPDVPNLHTFTQSFEQKLLTFSSLSAVFGSTFADLPFPGFLGTWREWYALTTCTHVATVQTFWRMCRVRCVNCRHNPVVFCRQSLNMWKRVMWIHGKIWIGDKESR